jgi:microcystin degradation protein MlrC
MYDPEVLQQAMDAGVGAQIQVSHLCSATTTPRHHRLSRPSSQVTLGGKLDEGVAGIPIRAVARVKTLTDGRFEATPGSAYSGLERNLGPIARLQIGNVDVLVNSQREQVSAYAARVCPCTSASVCAFA